ncbi:unnamed protein product [Chrysodeixis includens]|uniref:Uncharacterized protein n=1 Tax=Chrysodeixis includens TaxID=689277 RepID=A0A9P0C3D9_CHRIL|nr:unnamed protein product [Chrysodeixis includens]
MRTRTLPRVFVNTSVVIMMFNGLLMCGDSDASEVTKDSTGTCSLVDSASPTCEAGERAEYYYNKLLSTQQILENREETIRVQAGSLAVAEARIATLTERATDLRRDLDRKTKECQTLRNSMETCKVEKTDACMLTDKQMGHQHDIVSTLQDNLSVIEELYRECFYETAKQEDLIEMLRKSYLDVRLMDRQKADQIGRLQTVINTQKWSLDRCQDIALEVDNLKMEISSFLHSSTSTNNDSGMWERSEDSFVSAPGVQDDLQDIVDQLLRLQDILNTECICGLEEENKKLKREIESQNSKIEELNAKVCGLECTLATEEEAHQKYKKDMEAKDNQCSCLTEQLKTMEEDCINKSKACEVLTMQLQTMEDKLQENATAMLQLQKQNECQANTITELSEELEKANQIIKENCKVRSEVSYLTAQVALWRAQLADSEQRVQQLEADLACARGHCEHIEACYREKASSVAELQAQLEQAHARGAALCGEARHAVCAVRHWVRRMRDKHRYHTTHMCCVSGRRLAAWPSCRRSWSRRTRAAPRCAGRRATPCAPCGTGCAACGTSTENKPT